MKKTPPTPVDAIDHGAELATIDEKGRAPESRIKNAVKARQIYERLREDDREGSHNRTILQQMMDGNPPYKREELMATGQGYRTNLNFGEGEAALEDAMSAYIDLHHSSEMLLSVQTTFGDEPQQRIQWNQILSRGLTRMIRSWDGFTTTTLSNVTNFLTHGVSFAYFQDESDWRWDVAKFGDFLIPRRTKAKISSLEVAFCYRELSPSELYRFIQNEDTASKVGWNVVAVRKILMDSYARGMGHERLDNWERWQEMAKDCDLWMDTVCANIPIIHTWVQEFDGSVSHFIISGWDECKDFLFSKVSRFESMGKVFVPFTYGVGSTSNFHGIRGLAYKIFPHVQVSNRVRCKLIDSTLLSSSLMVKPGAGQFSKDAMAMSYMGPFCVMNPELEVVNVTPPNYGQNVIPVIQELDRLKRMRTGQYSAANVLPDRGELTRAEVNVRTSQAAQLSSVSLYLYYEPADRLLKEVVRRVKRKGWVKSEPGGEEVLKLREYLLSEGCPLEALYALDLDSVRTVRAVGAGSAMQRGLVFQELTEIAGSFDATGRQRLLRDRAAHLLGGYDMVDRYLPDVDDERVSDDAHIAQLENILMERTLAPVEIRPNDLHLDHLPVHVKKVQEFIAAADQGAPLEQLVQPLVLVHGHATDHLEMVQGDMVSQEEIALYRQALQQAGEIIVNGTRALQKAAREGDLAGTEAGAAQAEMGERMERDIIEHQTKLRMQDERHQQEMRHREEKALLERRLADAKAAAGILNQF